VATASSGSGPDGNAPVDDTLTGEAPPSNFRMGLDEAFRRRLSPGSAEGISRGPADYADLLAAVDRAFATWQDRAEGPAPSHNGAELASVVVESASGAVAELAPDQVDLLLDPPQASHDIVWLPVSNVAGDADLAAEGLPAGPTVAAVLLLASAYHDKDRWERSGRSRTLTGASE
jgi:hypothetical protein